MKPKSEKSIELYHIMTERGYPEEFCDVITRNLNTDFTAQRMLWYLSHYEYLPEGEIVDEMLAKTSTTYAPWHILESVDKKYARIKALKIVIKELEKALERV